MSETHNGWPLVSLREVTERVPNIDPRQHPDKEFEYVDISAVDNNHNTIGETKRFLGKDAPSRARRPVRPNDVLFSNVRTYLRNIAIVPTGSKATVCSTGFTVLRPKKELDPRYLFRYVLTRGFIDRVTPTQTGTHYPATSDRAVLAEWIPLPPIDEQRRIVAKLEALLARVNAARERLDKIPTLLKRFRQSVLTAACTGQLTADWREQNHACHNTKDVVSAIRARREAAATTPTQRARLLQIYCEPEESDNEALPPSWGFVKLKKLCRSFDYGTSAKSHASGKVPVLRMGNIQEGEIDWTDLVYTSSSQEINSYNLQPNTVLFNRTNSPELVGKTAIYRGERPAIFAGYLIRANPESELLSEYLNICLNTSEAKGYCQRVKSDGVSQSNINAQKLASYEIPLCSLDEQREIVRRVNAMLALTSRLGSSLASTQSWVECLNSSILSNAFRLEMKTHRHSSPLSDLSPHNTMARESETAGAISTRND